MSEEITLAQALARTERCVVFRSKSGLCCGTEFLNSVDDVMAHAKKIGGVTVGVHVFPKELYFKLGPVMAGKGELWTS